MRANVDGDDDGLVQNGGHTPAKRLTERIVTSLFDIAWTAMSVMVN